MVMRETHRGEKRASSARTGASAVVWPQQYRGRGLRLSCPQRGLYGPIFSFLHYALDGFKQRRPDKQKALALATAISLMRVRRFNGGENFILLGLGWDVSIRSFGGDKVAGASCTVS